MNAVKIPLNAGALDKKEGQEEAPEQIMKCANELLMNERKVLPVLNVVEIKVDNSNLEESHHMIYEVVKRLEGFSVLIGGDHSLTYPSFRAFAKRSENPGILVFDAHPDMMDSFKTHEDYLKCLIDDNIVKSENVILVGVRNWDKNEIVYLNEKKVKVFSMRNITEDGVHEISETVMQNVRNWDAFYLSIDIDVVDPAFAPGTGYIEPGGMISRDLIYFIQRLKNIKTLGMADIVEVNPRKDFNHMTSKLAAKLIWELA